MVVGGIRTSGHEARRFEAVQHLRRKRRTRNRRHAAYVAEAADVNEAEVVPFATEFNLQLVEQLVNISRRKLLREQPVQSQVIHPGLEEHGVCSGEPYSRSIARLSPEPQRPKSLSHVFVTEDGQHAGQHGRGNRGDAGIAPYEPAAQFGYGDITGVYARKRHHGLRVVNRCGQFVFRYH